MFQFGPVIALMGLALAAYTVYDLVHHWQGFWDDDIRPEDRQRTARIAFFLIIPIGVLLHEIGHTLAVWQLGGQVVEFNWSFLSGYVVPDRRFDALGEWWVYFSGNLVSILLPIVALGVAALPIGRMPRYLAITFARLQWYYSLIGYPLLSLGGAQGDWVAIYRIPPLPLKIVLAVVHVSLVLVAVWLERRPAYRRWDIRLSRAARDRVHLLDAAIDARPMDVHPRLELAEFYLEHGDTVLAETAVKAAQSLAPDDPAVLLAAGTLAMQAERYKPAADYFERALMGLRGPGAAVAAARLGRVYEKTDRMDQAITAYSQAIDLGLAAPDILFSRGRAYLRRRDLDAARSDFRRASLLDPEGQIGHLAQEELKHLS